MSTKLIEINGKQIIYADHRGLSGQQLIGSMRELTDAVIKNKYELLLADFREALVSQEAMDFLKGEETKKASTFFKKQAVLGISGKSGIRKFAVNIYSTITHSNVKLFDDEESAKEYLIS